MYQCSLAPKSKLKAAIPHPIYSVDNEEFNTKNNHFNHEKAHNDIEPVGHGNEALEELVGDVQDQDEFKDKQTVESEIDDRLLIAADKRSLVRLLVK